MQWLMLLLSSAVVLASGLSVATLWTKLSFFGCHALLLYHLAHGPCALARTNLLLAAARIRLARRATFLWAALPLVAIAGVEQIVFHTWHFARLGGVPIDGRRSHCRRDITRHVPNQPNDPYRSGLFLISPGLWIGLALAAAFLRRRCDCAAISNRSELQDRPSLRKGPHW